MALLRVVSWNLHGLRDDRAAVVRVLRGLNGDVVCLQEAPRLPMTPGSRSRLAELARRTGLHLVGGGRSAAGNALLVSPRVQVVEHEELRLPTSRWQRAQWRVAGAPVPVPRPRIGERRGVVWATVRMPGGVPPLVVACVHLGLDADERLRHAAMIVEAVRPRGWPAVIAGDLNEQPGGPVRRMLGEVAADPAPDAGPTFSARDPRYRIDAVLTSPWLTVASYGDGGVDPADARVASDHLPVVADLEVP